jgi:DNA-directed RNA polymerase specialized sigma24 family protein
MFSAISLVSNNWNRRSSIRARKEPEVKRQLEAREDQHEEAKHGFRIDHDVAVERLPPQQRAAYEALMLGDMTADEYAEQARISPKTAKNNLYHADKKMQQQLEDYRPGGRSDERDGR